MNELATTFGEPMVHTTERAADGTIEDELFFYRPPTLTQFSCRSGQIVAIHEVPVAPELDRLTQYQAPTAAEAARISSLRRITVPGNGIDLIKLGFPPGSILPPDEMRKKLSTWPEQGAGWIYRVADYTVVFRVRDDGVIEEIEWDHLALARQLLARVAPRQVAEGESRGSLLRIAPAQATAAAAQTGTKETESAAKSKISVAQGFAMVLQGLLEGVATAGQEIQRQQAVSEQALEQVRNGWSMQRVTSTCGSPNQRYFGHGGECWWYQVSGQVYIVKFDSSRKVRDVRVEEGPITGGCD